MTTKVQKAMRELASMGGRATVKKHGKGHMSKIVKDYWKSPAGRKRRAQINSK